ncbi:MAG: phosphoglycerate dehydrogenase [Nitrospira sp. SB0677_bin_15]|nr:phosphoglycerate dehydrogenase [Nitrospira sp. SB0667_bin_9]MYD31597.1 phosphoglycerate dehydrogenase [Nitrospira sp. SB0661_bin_20]MYG40306.1 phosphoglycerate dehydrogenase [Nitrospira sp. SB0677_bin_15]MYJ23775.1 phosphoglycerate dehydrogenase [Nitrospira sp. SB0673_bin_12]
MNILVSDSLSPRGVAVLEQGGFHVDVKTKLPKEQLLEEIKAYDGIVVRSGTKVTAEVIEAGSRLKIIGRAGTGLDNVDCEAATRRGIVVMNTPGGNTITTAEHTIAMLVSMSRRIPQAVVSTKAGKWEKSKFMGTELYNKTLGLVGLGQIGTYVTKLAQGLAMQVIGYDPYLSPGRARELGIQTVALDELFRRADFISVHTPLTNETRSLINAQAIRQMKDGVMIVNCARGGIIHEEDMYEALKSKKVAAAAFDVFEEEPVKPDHPLLTLDNFICTPHIGASTEEAQESVAVSIAEQFVDYFEKGVARGAVNIPSVPPDALLQLQPYLGLAERMGLFQAQLIDEGIEEVTVEYRGEVTEFSLVPLTVAVLKGLLTPILHNTVNAVNAPFIAKQRGIEVKEVKWSDAGDYTSLIRLHVKAGAQMHQLAGTLYNKKDARIVETNAYGVEVVPEGHMLLIQNVDRPGVIGTVGRILGEHGINIARMQCSRAQKGSNALLILGLDAPPPLHVQDNIKRESDIVSTRLVDLSGVS